MLQTNLLILLTLIIQINCQTCNDGNQYQYSQCSQNPACGCLQYSFSNSMYVCTLHTRTCAQYSRCQSPNDACQVNEICLRHPNCDSQPLCFPTSTINEQSCPPVYQTTEPPIYISNYTSTLDSLDGLYTRPGGSPSTYYEAIQLYVPISGYYDLSSISGMDTHGYLYNGTFYPSNPQYNLIAHNDDGMGNQFKIPIYLEAGIPYTLVVTTHGSGTRGPFSVIAKGPGHIYFYPLTPSTTTTTTTTTSRPLIVSVVHNNELTTLNPHYDRTGNSSQAYYYQAFEVRVNETGNYTFTSASRYDTYGYIYQGNFYPFLPQINVHAENDDGASASQFQITAELRSDVKYILVFTTYAPNTFGTYSVTGRGPGYIYFNPIQQTFQ